MSTPKNQMSIETINEVFEFKDGFFYWRKKPNRNIDISKPTGSVNKGYRVVRYNQKYYQYHNLIWIMNFGLIPEGLSVDHVDGNPLNNKINNLRLLTNREQGFNHKLYSKNTSGVTGVTWHKASKKWAVNITVNSKAKYFGCFIDIKEAIAVSEKEKAKIKDYKLLKRG